MQTTGRYLVQGPLYPGQDVATVNPVSTYTFYSYLDLANGNSLTPVNGTCNQNPNITDYTPALNSCNTTSGCCVDMSQYQVRRRLAMWSNIHLLTCVPFTNEDLRCNMSNFQL